MGAMSRPSAGFRWFAFLAALGAWALVAVGGLVRVTESGLGCPDWPLCDGRVIPRSEKTAIFEWSHRVTAATVTILLAIVAVWAWRRYRDRLDILVPALVAVAFVPGQAILGAIVVWLELPGWIVGVHFVIGLLMLGVAVVTAVASWRGAEARSTPGFRRLAAWTRWPGSRSSRVGAAVVSTHATMPAAGSGRRAAAPSPAPRAKRRSRSPTACSPTRRRARVWLAFSRCAGSGPLAAGRGPLAAVDRRR